MDFDLCPVPARGASVRMRDTVLKRVVETTVECASESCHTAELVRTHLLAQRRKFCLIQKAGMVRIVSPWLGMSNFTDAHAHHSKHSQ